jgi:hypothetical protein
MCKFKFSLVLGLLWLVVFDASHALATDSGFRVQNYSEWMSPALGGPSVPTVDGESLVSDFVDGRVWMDYALTPKYRILYWQRYFAFSFKEYSLYDPRIGFRWMQVFDVPGLTTTYDFYFLPGVSKLAEDSNRFLELGIRTNTSYEIPRSRWTVGVVTETNLSFYKQSQQAKNLWGVLAGMASYRLSSKLSTQHWFMFPIKYQQDSFAWDATRNPFVQNGLGWSATEAVWIGVFLNTYLLAAPTLQNTWASVWLNLAML